MLTHIFHYLRLDFPHTHTHTHMQFEAKNSSKRSTSSSILVAESVKFAKFDQRWQCLPYSSTEVFFELTNEVRGKKYVTSFESSCFEQQHPPLTWFLFCVCVCVLACVSASHVFICLELFSVLTPTTHHFIQHEHIYTYRNELVSRELVPYPDSDAKQRYFFQKPNETWNKKKRKEEKISAKASFYMNQKAIYLCAMQGIHIHTHIDVCRIHIHIYIITSKKM